MATEPKVGMDKELDDNHYRAIARLLLHIAEKRATAKRLRPKEATTV